MKNELPLILPITPADSPKKNIRTSQVTTGDLRLEELVQGPQHGDDGHDHDGDPCHCRHDADHDLEQDVRRNGQYADGYDLASDSGECSAAALLDVFAHVSIRANGEGAWAYIGRAREAGLSTAPSWASRPRTRACAAAAGATTR